MVPLVQISAPIHRADEPPEVPPRSFRDHVVAVVLGLVAFAIFWASPVQHQSDSQYTLLVSETLLRTGRFTLDEHAAAVSRENAGYNLERAGGHVYFMPPPGGAVFSIPFVLALRPFGISALDAEGRYDAAGEYRAQRLIAAALMAALAVLFYRTARLLLSAGWSVAVAAVCCLGTQVWSTASRALWSDTWSIALLGYVVWRIAALELRGKPILPEVLATLLAAVFFARPTGAAHVLVVTAYVAVSRRAMLARLVGAGAAWVAAFVAYSWVLYGRPVPSYYRFWNLGTSAGWQPLLANLFSPSRGLLVCVPLVPVVLYVAIRYRRMLDRASRRLAITALAGIAGQVLIVALWHAWWAGHSYGARFTTGAVPWLALLAAVGMRAALEARRRRAVAPARLSIELAAGAVLVVASVFIQARGALAESTQRWNLRPADVDAHPERVWDWRYPQWLAGLVPLPGGGRYPPLAVGETLALGPPEANEYLREGWSWPEEELRWTDESAARVQFAVASPRPFVLRMQVRPGPVWRELGGQPLSLELNGQPVAQWTLTEPGPARFAAGLGDAVQPHNVLVLKAPDMPPGVASRGDRRPLRTGVYWLRLDPYPPLRGRDVVALGRDEAQPYLGEGWGDPETAYRWTVAPRAELFLAPEGIRAGVLRLKLHPYPASARGMGQRMFVSLNGELVVTLALREGEAAVRAVALPRGLRGADRVTLELPDASPPVSRGTDTRQLGVAVHWLKLDPFPALAAGTAVDLAGPESDAFLGDGWGEREGSTRWTVGLSAEVFFAAVPPASTRLALTMEPLLHASLPSQRVRIELNGQLLGALALSQQGRRPYELRLPSGALQPHNVLRLSFPDARSPASLGLSRDRRLLGVRMGALELRP